MNTISKCLALLLLSEASYAQQPTDNVVSDACFNTAMGGGALLANENGAGCATSGYNTASGYEALYSNTTGGSNTAYGALALHSNTGATSTDPAAGSDNTAVGVEALYSNTTGVENTAIGFEALYLNTSGNGNTASGFAALNRNTSGTFNTASGYDALYSNTTGNNNTAFGYTALNNNTTGMNNTASGYGALFFSKTGQNNTASGYEALVSDSTGSDNTALGYEALSNDATGAGNIAVGYRAGYYVKDGYNIDIGNTGLGTDAKTIRIGAEGTQLNTYLAGIYNVNSLTGGLAVFVDSTGHLGTASSSERFKADIVPMGSNTEKLQQLRPVTFHYKADPQGTLRYGLIAEEVATVYPELVVRDQNGRIDGVRYDELAPMLLNEMQKERATIWTQNRKIDMQAAKIKTLEQQVAKVNELEQRLDAVLQQLMAKNELVAQR
jgi:hypothetical protein